MESWVCRSTLEHHDAVEPEDMDQPREIELKLRLDPAQIDKFTSLRSIASLKPKRVHYHTVYYDGRARQLARKGFELRVRSNESSHVQTVKAGSGPNRGEWETELEAETPSTAAMRATPAKKSLPKRAALEPVFDVNVDRTSWSISREGSAAEISLDTGRIAAGGTSEPIVEAEIELKEGSADLLFDLAREAIERCDAPLSFVGKGLRGRRLADGKRGRAEHGLDLHLSRRISVEDAFAQVTIACLQQMSINEEILRAHPDSVESVHQMRVA